MLLSSYHVPMDLRSGVRTYVDVDRLPLSDKQKRLVLRVQGADAKKEAYTLAHRKDRYGRLMITIKDIGKGLDGLRVDVLTGKVYDKNGRHEILPRTIHQRYESIATQLAAKYKRGELSIDDETTMMMIEN